MKDIAAELGISVATVSRALKDSPMISKQRREMIQKFAREHDFRPNAVAESLRQSRTRSQRIIGVIVPELKHFFFSAVLSGIEEEAAKHGYLVIAAQSQESYEREVAICDMMITNRICGIIVSQAKNTHKYDHFTKLQNENIPLVFCDRICTGIDASRVVVDDYHGAFTAVKHLIETGCGRIAFCGSSVKLEIMKNRLNGYRDALLQHNMEIDESLILECDNRGMSEQVIPQVLARDDRPDGFFAINDDTAVGVIHVAKQCGLRVPEDVSVCGFTNGERALACDPMLTTIDQRGPELGKQAADILISQVKGLLPMDKAHKRIVRTNLIVRGSTRINPTDRD